MATTARGAPSGRQDRTKISRPFAPRIRSPFMLTGTSFIPPPGLANIEKWLLAIRWSRRSHHPVAAQSGPRSANIIQAGLSRCCSAVYRTCLTPVQKLPMPSNRLSLAAAAAPFLLAAAAVPCFSDALVAQQPVDSAYSRQITELTPTDSTWKFTTELVDHLPASATVPTPLKVLGYVPGTIGRLGDVEELNRYFRAVEKASPRVRVFSLGMSDEGREMIVAAVADSATIAHFD